MAALSPTSVAGLKPPSASLRLPRRVARKPRAVAPRYAPRVDYLPPDDHRYPRPAEALFPI